MRYKFEFLGLNAPARRDLEKEFFSRLNERYPNENRWEIIYELWEKPQRELLYFAMNWTKTFKPKTLHKNDIQHIEFLLTNLSWWDSVDTIASNLLSNYHLQYPENRAEWLDEWRLDDNFWLRRSCLIFQLKYKDRVDFELLKSLILENQHDKEFFIQKAIGWSLRQYGKYQPEAVVRFVEEINLTGLAQREALKRIQKNNGTYKSM